MQPLLVKLEKLIQISSNFCAGKADKKVTDLLLI